MSLDTAFVTVYGREPKPEETNRFNKLAKELGIRENDAVWSLVFLLGQHLEMTEAIPERIRSEAELTLAKFQSAVQKRNETAEVELNAIKARIEERISKSIVASAEREIARSAQAVARHTASKSWLQWLGLASIIGMLILAGACWWGYSTGQRSGYAAALDVKEAESWAATPSGQAAYRMEQNGDLIHLIRCDQEGWHVEKTTTGAKVCFVRGTSDGHLMGWLLP
jgi:ElaB/YqjD/DUF883 family membrane-anchored ribosome-binding protein